jgi:hypothetical protein
MDTGKPRKTCVEVAGRRTFRTLPSRQQSGFNQESHGPHNNTITLRITTINTNTTIHMENYNNAHGKSTAITHNTVYGY